MILRIQMYYLKDLFNKICSQDISLKILPIRKTALNIR